MSSNSQITRFAGIMSVATLLSRMTGLARDILKAHFFGTGLAADAFTVAFRLPNLLRRLVGEGTLSAAFVPIYTHYRTEMTEEESWQLASAVFTLLTMILAVMTILGMALAGPLVKLFAPGFQEIPGKIELTISLTRWLFPYILFVGLAALAMAILNTHKRFFIPALAPIILNLAMILAMIFLCPNLGESRESQIYGLAFGTLIGGIGQLAIQIPGLRQIHFPYRPRFDWRHLGVRRIVRLMGPGLIALGVAEINIFVDTFLASTLEPGSVAALEYANRLMQLPLGVFAISITTAILPTLSEQASLKDMPGLKSTLSYALRLIFFIMFPAAAGLIAVREPIVMLIFQRGAFDAQSTYLTGIALSYYVIGLFAYGGVKAVAQAFFALQDTKTPVKVGVMAMIVNIVLNFILIHPLKLGGLALATSIAAIFNMSLLLFLLRKRIGEIDQRRIWHNSAKMIVLSLLMALAVYFSLRGGHTILPLETWPGQLLLTGLGIMVGSLCYAGGALLLKLDEMLALWAMVKRKLRK